MTCTFRIFEKQDHIIRKQNPIIRNYNSTMNNTQLYNSRLLNSRRDLMEY